MNNMIEERMRVVCDNGIAVSAVLAYADNTARDNIVFIFPPHPNLGGAFDNNVVHALYRHIVDRGALAIAINYRGIETGEVEGKNAIIYWDELERNKDYTVIVNDSVTVIDQIMRAVNPNASIYAAAYSFGNYIALNVSRAREITAFVGISPPISAYDFTPLFGTCEQRHFIISKRDTFCAPDVMRQYADEYHFPCTVLEGDDHFFRGREDVVAGIAAEELSIVWNQQYEKK